MTLSAIALLLAAAVGAAACELPEISAGTALDTATIEGFVVTEVEGEFAKFLPYAPVFLVEHAEETYNRIGTPSARLDRKGREEIYVDVAKATYYVEEIAWETETAKYTNLVYRVHFEESRPNTRSTDGGRGHNVGLMLVVTLGESGKPLYLNAVHTCACYHGILPTAFLPESAYPEHWDRERHDVWGEHLPGIVNYPADYDDSVRPVLYLRTGSHRVTDVQVASISSVRERFGLLPATMASMDTLKHLPLGDGETSFFFETGKNKGLVKGAYKRKESLLLGLWTGDTRVGQDRFYGSGDDIPRGFYTSINPAKKEASDMWDYERFLTQNGWKP